MPFLDKILKTIKDYNMLQKNDVVIVGVSGGPDSIALLHILNSLKNDYNLKLFVVHVNHMFRGRQAEEEADFVAHTAQQLGLEYKIFAENVPEIIKAKGLSPQEAGHQVRKKIFNSVRKEINGGKLALGHHADDRGETLLMHLIQGTGLDGLASMAPVGDWIIRPLSQVTKEEILSFCRAKDLKFVLDPSNEKPVYLRNKIRLQLLPYLKREFNPNIIDGLLKLEEIVWTENDFLKEQTEEVENIVVSIEEKGKLKIDIPLLQTYHQALQRRVIRKAYSLLKPQEQSLSFIHVEKLLNLTRTKEGQKELNLPKGVRAIKGYDTLELLDTEYFSPGEKILSATTWEIPGTVDLPDLGITMEGYYSEKKPLGLKDFYKVALNREKIQSPLLIRPREGGDRIQPLGMMGSKKIKELFIDLKIPREKRNSVPLVCMGDEIIWIPGITINEKYRWDKAAEGCLVLEMKKGEYV